MNLTAVRDRDSILRRHFAESLFAAQQIPAEARTLLDIGSGAGFPGIPIAIARPEIAVTLAESQNKKAAFLREVIRTLGLPAEVWASRVEEMPPGRLFDAVTLRAVEKMPLACRIGATHLAPEGWMAAFTTRAAESALDGIEELRWTESLPIPGSRQEVLRIGRRSEARSRAS